MKILLGLAIILLVYFYIRKKIGPVFKSTFYFTIRIWFTGLCLSVILFLGAILLKSGLVAVFITTLNFIPVISLIFLYSLPAFFINALLNYLLTPPAYKTRRKYLIPLNSGLALIINFFFILTIESGANLFTSLTDKGIWIVLGAVFIIFLLSAFTILNNTKKPFPDKKMV